MVLEALALERMNDRHRDNGHGRVKAGMDGGAMRNGDGVLVLDPIRAEHGQSEPYGSGEGQCMWYVMQVVSGQENRTVRLIEKMVPEGILEGCWVPLRRLRKKFHGTWHEVTEKLFPGYVFLSTKRPQPLYEGLKEIPALTRALGRCGEYFEPLPEEEVRLLLQKLKDKPGEDGVLEMGISKISVEEGKRIRILDGPLKDLEGQVRKIDLHKRTAAVELEFMGRKTVVHLGIEMVGQK